MQFTYEVHMYRYICIKRFSDFFNSKVLEILLRSNLMNLWSDIIKLEVGTRLCRDKM